MKYNEIFNTVREPILSLQDIKLAGLSVFPYQLSSWSKKGYITKLKNGLYLFNERKDSVSGESIAFTVYQPSYVSLERALSRYGIIPEMVYNVTSITSKTTRTFKNDMGIFVYRHIKKGLFFGYRKVDDGKGVYLLAEPEKALLDYLYLNLAKLRDKTDIEELRLNRFSLDETINKEKLMQYTNVFDNKKLNRILKFVMEQ